MSVTESATEIRSFTFEVSEAAWQEPDIYTTEVRAGFNSLRRSS